MKKREIAIIFIVSLIGILYLALISAAYYYTLNGYADINIDEWGTCRNVVNSLSVSYFVPTKTSTEWSSFYNNPPSGVSSSGSCSGPECMYSFDCSAVYPACYEVMDCIGDYCCNFGLASPSCPPICEEEPLPE